MDYRIFNVHTDVNAHDCTQGRTDTVRKSALKVDSRGKIICHTVESNLFRQRAGPKLYQLSYIPTSTGTYRDHYVLVIALTITYRSSQ